MTCFDLRCCCNGGDCDTTGICGNDHPDAHRNSPLSLLDQQPQRQDSLHDQLADLAVVATRLGMYDAADWINHVVRRTP